MFGFHDRAKIDETLIRYALQRRRRTSLTTLAFILFIFGVTTFYFFPYLFHNWYMVLVAALLLAGIMGFYAATQEFMFLLLGAAYTTAILSILLFRSLIPFAILWAVGIFLFYNWATSGPPSTVEYRPPQGISPEEVAYMIEDRAADERELLVTLLELERKGVVELIPSKNDFYIRRLRDMNELDDLNPLERFVMTRVFTMTGVRTILESGIQLNYNEFPSEVSLDYVLNNLTEWKKAFDLTFKDYLTYHKPVYYRFLMSSKRRIMLLGLAAALWAVFVAYLYNFQLGKSGDYLLSFFIFGAVTALFGWKYTGAMTALGKSVYAKIKGFEEFLRRVEWPRLRWMLKTGRITVNELFLYAIAFKMFNSIDFWLMRIRKDKSLDLGDISKIEKLWKLINFRWHLSNVIEEFEGGYKV